MKAEQIPLSLQWPEDYSEGSFIVGDANQMAYEWIKRWPDWPQNTLALSADRGGGKTHLAHIYAEMSGAKFVPARALENLDWRQHKDFVIENGPPPAAAEKTMFHLINWVREEGGSLLLTGRTAPATWGVSLKDCASRLDAVVCVQIKAPDDILLQQLLVKQFAQRGASVSADVLNYILSRVERSFDGIKSCVWRVNYLAMVRKSPVTTAVVRQAMGW